MTLILIVIFTLISYVNSYVNSHILFSPYDTPLIRIVKIAHNHGIRIVKIDKINTRILGSYIPTECKVILYNVPHLLKYNKEHEITLKHELVHAIQHCKGHRIRLSLLMGLNSIQMCINSGKINKTRIDEHYREQYRVLEYEAHCIDDLISYKLLEENIKKYCSLSC